MKKLRQNSGFTLLEVVLSLFLAGILAAGIVIMFPPSITFFSELTDADATRQAVISPLEMVGSEVSTMRAVYIDNTKCYALCMEYVDVADDSHHRIFYYWQDENLMRKKELTSSGDLDCTSGGHQFVGSLDTAKTTFSMNRELLSVNVAAKGRTNEYQLSAVFMPIVKEREILFTEGFECDTLTQGTGWSASGGTTAWSIVDATQGFGTYELASPVPSGTTTGTLEMALDMTRYPKALLTFNYRNQSTSALPVGEGFFVDWYDGSAWGTVFSHTDTDDPPLSATTKIQVDLTDYGLVATSKLRFRSISSDATARWYLDNIQVTSP